MSATLKYRNTPTNGYDSKGEAKRANELRLLERAGEIRALKEQVAFLLIPAQYVGGKCVERSCKYVADFTYQERISDAEWRQVVEDHKGYRDPIYRIKRKMMLSTHGIRIRET